MLQIFEFELKKTVLQLLHLLLLKTGMLRRMGQRE